MSDLKTFVKNVVAEQIKASYPGARIPANMVAVIKSRGKAEGLYRYTLRVLDQQGNETQEIPELPGIISDQEYEVGTKVVIANIQSILQPYIVGRWYQ